MKGLFRVTRNVIGLVGVVMLGLAYQVSSAAQQNSSENPVSLIDDVAGNSIKLLKNRFRVDYKVDELTLLFFRNYGSAPVILIQPNGVKLYQDRSETNPNVDWFDDLAYDMIKIKQPMPGPWQVIGEVLPHSRVMVLSDLALVVDPLPSILFSGEIVKKTVRLVNDGKPIDQNEFRDVVNLDVRFNSTNNQEAANFALPSVHITQFQDNGKGMDERPNDGVFTGTFNLGISPGEWEPVFDIVTPMFSRQYRHEFINLLPPPVAMSVDIDSTTDGSGEHTLFVYADSPFIQQEDFVISGSVQSPNGDVQNFSVSEVDENGNRSVEIPNYLSGVYRVNVTLFGTTIDDREIVVTIPEYSFVVEDKLVIPETANSDISAASDDNSANQNLISDELAMYETATPSTQIPTTQTQFLKQQPTEQEFPWLILILANLGVVLLGGIGLLWFWLKRR